MNSFSKQKLYSLVLRSLDADNPSLRRWVSWVAPLFFQSISHRLVAVQKSCIADWILVVKRLNYGVSRVLIQPAVAKMKPSILM